MQHLKTSNSDRAMVHSVIDLAHHFKLQVVAEGVEDLATMDELIWDDGVRCCAGLLLDWNANVC